MQTDEFLIFLKRNEMPVFTLVEAERILQKRTDYVKLFLHRCVKRDVIGRATSGLYYLKQGTNELEIASSVIPNSYVSLISALSYYGLTTQISHVVYVLSPNRHQIIRDVLGYEVKFRQIKWDMLYGFSRKNAGKLSIANPEKAIVDIFYLNEANDLDEDSLDPPARIDLDLLVRYALKSDVKRVIQKVAGLIESHGYVKESKELRSQSAKRGLA